MTYSEQVTRTFEVRNEGLFKFKFAICDSKDEEARKRIKEERLKEIEERVKGAEEKKDDPKADPKLRNLSQQRSHLQRNLTLKEVFRLHLKEDRLKYLSIQFHQQLVLSLRALLAFSMWSSRLRAHSSTSQLLP